MTNLVSGISWNENDRQTGAGLAVVVEGVTSVAAAGEAAISVRTHLTATTVVDGTFVDF